MWCPEKHLDSLNTSRLSKLEICSASFWAKEAFEAYQKQPLAKKQLSPLRFWQRPKSLKECCIQSIAANELKTGKRCNRDKLPTTVYKEIDDRLEKAYWKINNEKISIDFSAIQLTPLTSIQPYKLQDPQLDYKIPNFRDFNLHKLNLAQFNALDERFSFDRIFPPHSAESSIFKNLNDSIIKPENYQYKDNVIKPGEHQYNESVREIKTYALILKEQHLNPNSFFSRLEKYLLVETVSEMRDKVYHDKEDAKNIAQEVIFSRNS